MWNRSQIPFVRVLHLRARVVDVVERQVELVRVLVVPTAELGPAIGQHTNSCAPWASNKGSTRSLSRSAAEGETALAQAAALYEQWGAQGKVALLCGPDALSRVVL